MRWSQEKLAEQMNVSKNTIHEIETGKKFVRSQRLADFAAVFNIEVYKLFLPENIRDYDANVVVARYTEEAKDALENLLGDFLNKGH
jgi:transcriptional regulator with XRE-family HTH domain